MENDGFPWDSMGFNSLVNEQFANWKMTIEIVDFPIKNGDFPVRYVSLPEVELALLQIGNVYFACIGNMDVLPNHLFEIGMFHDIVSYSIHFRVPSFMESIHI